MKNKLVNLALIIISPSLILIFLELLSYGTIHASIALTGRPKPFLESQPRFDFHPIWTQSPLLFSDPFGLTECRVYHPNFGTTNKISKFCRRDGMVDRYGFLRNSLADRELRKGSFLVFTIGGSTVQGVGASSIETNFTSILDKNLKKKFGDVEVINTGQSGYYAPQEIDMLIHKIIPFKPNMIISISGSNDYRHADRGPISVEGQKSGFYFLSSPQATIYNHMNFRSTSVIHSLKAVFLNLRTFLFRYTYTGYILYKIQNLMPVIDGEVELKSKEIVRYMKTKAWRAESVDSDFENEIDEELVSYVRYIQMTRAIATELDIQYLYVIQPMALWDRHELGQGDRIVRDRLSATRFLERGVNSEKRARYFVASLKNALRSKKINYLDLTDVFDDGVDVYTDGIHYNDLGNSMIADALENEIVSRKLMHAR